MPQSSDSKWKWQLYKVWLLASIVALVSFSAHFYQTYYISHPADHIYSDMHGYISRAWRIAAESPFEKFDTFFPPGTSYYYALFFNLFGFDIGLMYIALSQCVMMAVSNVLIFLLLNSLFSHATGSFIASMSLALYWPRVTTSSFYVSEPLFIFFMVLSQYLLLRALKKDQSITDAVLLGLCIGLSIIVKGQGLAIFGTYILLLALPSSRHIRAKFSAVLLGLVVVFTFHFGLNSKIMGKASFFISANDAFNAYLGQSQREAIVGVNPETLGHYVYHNNNAAFNEHLSAPILFETDILNRDFFRKKVFELWLENPIRQVVRGLNSSIELFSDELEWPPRNLESIREMNQEIKTLFFICLWPSALLGLVYCMSNSAGLWRGMFLALPLLGVAGVSFMSMGQPRYLSPFLHNAVGLALAAALKIYYRVRKVEGGNE